MPDYIVLFDGVCNLCNASVNFIIDHDPEAKIKFAALQSEAGQELLLKHNLETQDLDSMVFISQTKAYIKSDAVLRLASQMGLPWSLGSIFLYLPRFLRNPIYEIIAHNRYRWFGKKDQCRVPTPQLRKRFLD